MGQNNDDDAIVATREMIEQAEEEIKILGHVSFEEGKTEEVDREDHDHNQAHTNTNTDENRSLLPPFIYCFPCF